MNAPLLLALTFANGIGLAMRWPVFAAIVPEIVPRHELPAALALNGVAMNMSRVIGPVVAGALLFPWANVWVFGLLALIVVPTDLAPAVAMVRDVRVPARLREVLNVEAGLNDALAAPLFLFCLAGAEAAGDRSVSHALVHAVSSMAVALGVGAAVGVFGGRALAAAHRAGWAGSSALRLGVLALPGLAYAAANPLGGNGFVAAFVAGAFFASTARDLPEGTLNLVEDVGLLLSLAVWFTFGQVVNQVLRAGIPVEIIVYALLALTLVRVLPVLASLRGVAVGSQDKLFLAWAGPRGLASIVFGLLAYIALSGDEAALVAEVMAVTVVFSILLHGFSAGPIVAAYGRRAAREDKDLRDPG